MLALAVSLAAIGQISPKDLPARHRAWLQEEAVYIITPKEKDVFLQLQTDRERDLFIEAFWKQRDPTPGSAENESKTEHYKRIDYANHYFGREATGAGWRTDMGRIYIVLGPPQDIETYDMQGTIYATQVWTYSGDPALGLPPSFNVVFFKRNGVGNYVLYSPVKDGPGSLIAAYTGDPTDVASAYRRLVALEPNVAMVSLSLIPGSRDQYDPTFRSLASDLLISASIPSVPFKKVETAYAEKLLRYKDLIEVEYSANYIDNDALVKVIRDASGVAFVHYSLEPRRLSIEQYESKFSADLDVSGMVTDAGGKTIYQFKRTLPLEFNADQVEKIKSRLFSSQDMFPLVEGSYKFSLLMKNTVSKEFTSMEKDLFVPGPRSLQMGPLILAYRTLKSPVAPGTNKPFLVGGVQLVASPRNDFSRSDDRLYLFFQVYGLEPGLRSTGSLRFTIQKDDQTVDTKMKRLDVYGEAPDILEEFDLRELPPATYSLKVALLDDAERPLVEKEEFFFISHAAAVPRPWVVSQTSPAGSDPACANVLGGQYVQKQDVGRALPLLEKAHLGRPGNLAFALDYARALFLQARYQQARDVLAPYLQAKPDNGELLGFLGSLEQQMGDLEQAIVHYKASLEQQGANLKTLNAIGECYYKLGNNAEALIAWERSLEIDPKQEEIAKLVRTIKK